MKNEPKAMREIHEIRIKNYENEQGLSERKLAEKRKNDIEEVERIIAEFGLNVATSIKSRDYTQIKRHA